MTVGDFALRKGVPLLAKKSLEVGRYYASEAMRDPKLQKKLSTTGGKKLQPQLKSGKYTSWPIIKQDSTEETL